MRAMILVAALAAGSADAREDFSTRAGCMRALSPVLVMAAMSPDRAEEFWRHSMAGVPDALSGKAEDVIAGAIAAAQAQEAVAAALMRLCAAYPDD